MAIERADKFKKEACGRLVVGSTCEHFLHPTVSMSLTVDFGEF